MYFVESDIYLSKNSESENFSNIWSDDKVKEKNKKSIKSLWCCLNLNQKHQCPVPSAVGSLIMLDWREEMHVKNNYGKSRLN